MALRAPLIQQYFRSFIANRKGEIIPIVGTLSIGDDEVFGRRPEVAEVT